MKKKFNLALLFSLTAGIIIAFGTYMYWFNKPEAPQTSLPEEMSITTKQETENEINQLLDEANYCEEASDCMVVSYGCPFGCSNLVNNNHDMAEIDALVEKYHADSLKCVYDCDVSPSPDDIQCIDQKCIDIRYY